MYFAKREHSSWQWEQSFISPLCPHWFIAVLQRLSCTSSVFLCCWNKSVSCEKVLTGVILKTDRMDKASIWHMTHNDPFIEWNTTKWEVLSLYTGSLHLRFCFHFSFTVLTDSAAQCRPWVMWCPRQDVSRRPLHRSQFHNQFSDTDTETPCMYSRFHFY